MEKKENYVTWIQEYMDHKQENLNLKIIYIPQKQLNQKTKNIRKNKVDAENHKEFIKNNRLTLKSNQRFRGKKNVFTDKVNKITLSANDDKIMQSIDMIETYAYGRNEEYTKKEKKLMDQYNKTIQKMKND